MIRRLIRWTFYLFITFVVLLVAGILLLDTVAKEILQSRIRASTGMDVKIGKLSIGLLSPTFTVEDFKLYNKAEYGGSLCLDLPELHVEYDRNALQSRKIHLKLLRLNLAELNIVNGKAGASNFKDLEKKPAAAAGGATGGSSKWGKWDFTGIDTLNVSIQKLRTTYLEATNQSNEVNLNIKNKVFKNLKTPEDFRDTVFLLLGNAGQEIPIGNTDSPLKSVYKGLKKAFWPY